MCVVYGCVGWLVVFVCVGVVGVCVVGEGWLVCECCVGWVVGVDVWWYDYVYVWGDWCCDVFVVDWDYIVEFGWVVVVWCVCVGDVVDDVGWLFVGVG